MVLCQCLVISVIELNGSDYFTPFVIIGYNITIQSRIQSTNNWPWVNYLPIFGADSMKQNQWLGHMDLMTSRWKNASKRWAEDQYRYRYMFSSVLIWPDLKSYLSLTAWLLPSLPHGNQSSHVSSTVSDGFITTSNSSHNWQWVVQRCCIEFFVASAVRPLAQSLHNMVCLPCLVNVYFHSHTPCLLVLLVLLKNLHLQW